MNDMIISHVNLQAVPSLQSNEEHSKGVAALASRFAAEFGFGAWGEVLGLLHDKGKEQAAFQRYIQKVSGYNPEIGNAPRTPHAFVGALIARDLYKQCYPLLSYPIMAHHAGLDDWGEFNDKMQAKLPSDVKPEKPEITLTVPVGFALKKEDWHHLIRMLYSCLVDADYLDTERFMKPEQASAREGKLPLEQLLPILECHLETLKSGASDTPVNRIRAEIQTECRRAADNPPGFYSLTVPTGGGKTLSSLLWAMLHARKHRKKRIIIAIPFTSIIVQTAEILRTIFGKENVLEHHSNVDYREKKEDELDSKEADWQMRLATENWDAPIVVTTNVQLFESMFSNRPSKCRKLHNICNSVLILDEVQSLPFEQLQPIVDSLKTYQRLFGASVLFTTASQPALKGDTLCGKRKSDCLRGIGDIHEIIDHPDDLSRRLRRAEILIDDVTSTYDDIAERISKHPRMLCIVNTRKDAQEIYSRLPQEGLTYHLSRMMCPIHVRQTIEKIKTALKTDAPIIRVVATQLIEAGVDIDFPVVFRQGAGLDSIIQAAGRCNREGKQSTPGKTYVFKLDKPLPPGSISHANDAMSVLINKYGKKTDWFAPATITDYFKQLYYRTETFDKADIRDRLYKPLDFYFETIAHEFQLINDSGVNIVVNFADSIALIKRLQTEGLSRYLMQQLGQYSVCVRQYDFEKLKHIGLQEIVTNIFLLPDREQYSEKTGLSIENHWLDEILIR
jgi:CRISPR-associated endonuclease/helicase Cas3